MNRKISTTFAAACLLAIAPALAGTSPAAAKPVNDNETVLIRGTGTIGDATHPRHIDDSRTHAVSVTIDVSALTADAKLVFEVGDEQRTVALEHGALPVAQEAPATLGDLDAAGLSALHPAVLQAALAHRPQATRKIDARATVFAWNGHLWTVQRTKDGRVREASRTVADPLHGDLRDTFTYEPADADADGPSRGAVTTVKREGRTLATMRFSPAVPAERAVGPELAIKTIGTGLHIVDIKAFDMRVAVVELADGLFVIDGTRDEHTAQRIAFLLDRTFEKPVRYFAFSHIHGQYVAGVRTWVGRDAVVLAPPATLPLLRRLFEKNQFTDAHIPASRLDDAQLQPVDGERTVGERVTAFNVPSDHTDDYLIFYAHRAKALITGDLFLPRRGQPLAGRSLRLCDFLAKHELQIETVVATWPINGTYEVESISDAATVRALCAGGALPVR